MLVEFVTLKETEVLLIKLEQFYDIEQANKFINSLRETLDKSKKQNLVVGTDISDVRVFSAEILAIMEDCQKLIANFGVKKIGRLINSSILEMQLRRTGKQVYSKEVLDTVKIFQNREEWENYLSAS